LHIGDRVTLEPGTTCRMCTDCRMGRYQVGQSQVKLMLDL
jgi:D-xylulose reductase